MSKKTAAPRELSPEEIEEYKDNFMLFDTKGDNKVQGDMLGSIVRALGFNPTQALVKTIAGEKLDEYTRVTWEEFFPMLQAVRETKREGKEGTVDDFFECFKVFDKEDNGQVNAGEMTHVLCTLAERLAEHELEPLMTKHVDAAGNLAYEDFIKYLMADPLDLLQ